mgnify:FL=1
MLSKFDFGLGNIEREQQWQSYNYRVKGLEEKKTFPCCVSTLYIFYNIICITGP